ncbi:MAG: hypothetical protein IKA95_06665 [Clostridia bacterium]|nr:hypothetical protein [Clostridia bacterium]
MKEYIFTTAITLVLAVIGYFLKRTMAKLDSNEERISNVEKNYEPSKAHSADMKEIKNEVENISKSVSAFRDNYVSKEEFVRSISEMNRKFDRVDDKLDRMSERTNDKLDRVLSKLNKSDGGL